MSDGRCCADLDYSPRWTEAADRWSAAVAPHEIIHRPSCAADAKIPGLRSGRRTARDMRMYEVVPLGDKLDRGLYFPDAVLVLWFGTSRA